MAMRMSESASTAAASGMRFCPDALLKRVGKDAVRASFFFVCRAVEGILAVPRGLRLWSELCPTPG